ncbi:hypothetical protein EDD21DRAFT_434348 [Dissophora ornata]|nr:hypothetical protein EDD21DRAFT_434348 [Dissophora ornata]
MSLLDDEERFQQEGVGGSTGSEEGPKKLEKDIAAAAEGTFDSHDDKKRKVPLPPLLLESILAALITLSSPSSSRSDIFTLLPFLSLLLLVWSLLALLGPSDDQHPPKPVKLSRTRFFADLVGREIPFSEFLQRFERIIEIEQIYPSLKFASEVASLDWTRHF